MDKKQLENVKIYKYLGRMLTNGRRCTCEIKFKSALDLKLRK
jgi:hypothetical protein